MHNKNNKALITTSYLFSLLVLAYVFVYFFVFKPIDTRFSSFGTSPILNINKISPGYTLIAPYNRILNQDPKWKGKIYLLDLFGRPVHSWETSHQALYSILKPNGNLLAVMESTTYSQLYPPGGNTGTVQELDLNSKVVWEYKNEAMHHDIVSLPNGDIVVAIWEKTPPEIAQKIQGGVEGAEIKRTQWSDVLVEINHNKEIVWSWHASEHLDPQVDTIDPEMSRYGWTYTNGISYVEKNPIDGSEAFLVSMRTLDEVIIIRKSDGEIIWRSPKNLFNTQHDPTIMPNGNVMVFDNGFTRRPNPFSSYGSRAIEIDPRTNKMVWQFNGGAGVINQVRLFAPIVGGAQRLPNGNTLITDGPKGHVFEVTPKGEVVWDMISPYLTQMTGPFPNNFLFKTRRYAEDQIKFPEKIAPSINKPQYFLYQILKRIYP